MLSTDRGTAVAPLLEGTETMSPAIAAPAAHSWEKCAACGMLCRPNRSPQLLPCLHSVCKVCIPPVGVEETQRECPNCKRPYNVLEVTDNPLLKDSSAGTGAHRLVKCAGCEDTDISGWCVECGEALCSICVCAHQRVRVTREHTVLPHKLPPGFIPTSFCPLHREEPMKLFCVSCNQLTCRDCQLTYHRNHSYQFLNEAVTAQREQIESLLGRVRQQRATVKQSLLDLDGRLQDLEEIKSKLKGKLQKVLIYIRCALLKRTAELFKNIQDLYGCEAQKITERQNSLRTLEERQEYILSFTERALQMENHSALLSCKRQVQSQLQDLLSQSATPPASMIDVRLHFEHQAFDQMAAFGKVVSNGVPFSHKANAAAPKKPSLPPVPRQNVCPAPSSYQPYYSTRPTPPPSHGRLASPQLGPAAECRPSVAPPPYSVTPGSAPTSQAPLAAVSQQSTTATSLPSVSSSAPPAPHHAGARTSAPSPPASLANPLKAPRQPPQRRKNKQSWSFHPYQPKDYKPAGLQPNACSPEPPQPPGISPPASASDSPSPPVSFPPAVFSADAPDACPSVEPAGGARPDGDEQQLRTQQYVPPVKAPADSPCERAPPAGGERAADPNPSGTEDEPTSTVSETDTEGCRGADGDAASTCATRAEVSAGDAAANGAPAFGCPLQTQAEVRAQPCPQPHRASPPTVLKDPPSEQFSYRKAKRPAKEAYFQPHKMQDEEGRTSTSGNFDSKSAGSQKAPPSKAGPLQIPVRPLERCDSKLPTSFRELLERSSPGLAPADPEAFVKNPLLRNLLAIPPSAETLPTDQAAYRGSPVETEKTDDDDEDVEDVDDSVGTDPKSENPVAFVKNRLLRHLLAIPPSAETVPTDQAAYRGSPVETEKTDDDDEDVEDVDDSVGTDPKSESDEGYFGGLPEVSDDPSALSWQSSSAAASGFVSGNGSNRIYYYIPAIVKSSGEESGGPIGGPWLPLVSVVRLPVSVPPPGEPLPQYRLLPGAAEDEILLQMMEDDEFPDGQSAQGAKKRPSTRLSDQSKARLIVLRGRFAIPTRPRMPHHRANHCPAPQKPPSEPEGPTTHKAVRLRCAACRGAGGLSVCALCGRGFHRDCHIPPIGSASSADWQCMLCRDLSDVGDLYSDERPRRPSLSLPDQRKCEHLLLALMCKKYSAVLYRKVELSSHYVDITLIRGRLLRKLSPPYRTPSEFVSDIWVLLETLSKNPEETGLVFRMQKYFQRKLGKTFGDALHPSLLKCPGAGEDKEEEEEDEEEGGETARGEGGETGKVRETLKRMREFLAANRQALAKKACKGGAGAAEPEEWSQGPA